MLLTARAGKLPVVLCHVTAPWTGELLLLRTDATPCRIRNRRPLPNTQLLIQGCVVCARVAKR
jgi:hypothetical protein